MAVRDAFLAEFDHEMGTTRKLLDRVPDAELAWKPHDKSMSLGRLATHVATIPHWSESILKTQSFNMADAPPPEAPKQSRADLLRVFDEAVRTARAAMDVSDAEWMAMWSFRNGPAEIFSMPRASAFRTFVLNHGIHHRGQLSVYLRLLNIPVPAIYGPSADEQ
jgi:uncharacterized damage-inducible protein DinB